MVSVGHQKLRLWLILEVVLPLVTAHANALVR
jgi:hypothetical protein